MIIVRSYNTSKMAIQTDLTEDTIQFIRRMLPNAIIGISDSLPLTHLDEAIAQCSTASLSGAHDINGIVYYRDVGISKLLMKLISHPDLEEYYRSLIKPINEYDKNTSQSCWQQSNALWNAASTMLKPVNNCISTKIQ